MKTEFKYDHVFMIEWKDLSVDHVLSNLRGSIDYYTPSMDRSIEWRIPGTDITLYISNPLEAGNKKKCKTCINGKRDVIVCFYGHGTAFEVCEKEKEKGVMND